MTVKDYAKEMNVKSNEVLKIAKEYDLNLNSENDIFSWTLTGGPDNGTLTGYCKR